MKLTDFSDEAIVWTFILLIFSAICFFNIGYTIGNFEYLENRIDNKQNITYPTNNNDCNYEILTKKYEMYKEYSKLEFDNYRACKDGMIK